MTAPSEKSPYTIVWVLLLVGGGLFLLSLIPKWRDRAATPAKEPEPQAAAEPVAPRPVPRERTAGTSPEADRRAGFAERRQAGPSRILDRDPDALRRQTEDLLRQANAPVTEEAGPSSLTLTEERIRALERNGEMIQ